MDSEKTMAYAELFFFTPELVLHLCQFLDDTDLLVLSQVCRRLNTLALHTFFIYHGTVDVTSGIFSLSTLSLTAFGLALTLPPITNLSCTFDVATAIRDITSLRQVLSRLPPIPELTITTTCIVSPRQQLVGPISQLLFTFYPYQNFIVLWSGYFFISRHRRMVHTKALPCPNIRIHTIWSALAALALSPLTFSISLVQFLVDLVTIVSTPIRDPHIHHHQQERIYKDLNSLYPLFLISPRMRILTIPSLSKWTMVTFDESVEESLFIEHKPFLNDEKWHSVLSSVYLPRLSHLSIKESADISLSTLVAFLNRHPDIVHLSLGHYSITRTSYPSSLHATLPLLENCLHQLTVLSASSRLVHLLLQSTALPNLAIINIGATAALGNPWAKIETPFDFVALDRALTTVMGYGHLARRLVDLTVTLPGGTLAKKWLIDRTLNSILSAAGVVPLLVKCVSITTERGIPLHRSLTLLLADWILKEFATGELKKVRLMTSVLADRSRWLVFEKRIKEATEDVVVETPGYR